MEEKMENKRMNVLVIQPKEISSRVVNLISSLGKKLNILVEIDKTTTKDASLMMIKKKYDRVVWLKIDVNDLRKISEEIFKEGARVCLVI